jgi:putative transposase
LHQTKTHNSNDVAPPSGGAVQYAFGYCTLRFAMMPNYRRVFVPGGCWFFTVNLEDRTSGLLTTHFDVLSDAIQHVQQRFPFEIDALVVLPDHLHAIWTLPDGDENFPLRWRLIKARFSKALPNVEPRSTSRHARGERGIWQRRYWEHLIRNDRDLREHIDYCWYNPVKHGYVENVEEWPYSTFHRDTHGNPRPEDFERAIAAHAKAAKPFGERE